MARRFIDILRDAFKDALAQELAKLGLTKDDLRQAYQNALRTVLGEGADITAANPLDVSTVGSQTQPLQQRPVTYDLLAQLRHEGVEVDPRDIINRVDRVLGQITDGTSPVNPANFGSGEHPRKMRIYDDTLVTPAWVDLTRTILREANIISPLSAGGNINVNLNENVVGIATDATLSSTLPRKIEPRGVRVPFENTFTAEGTITVYTPSAGKKVRVLGFFYYCDSDVISELRYATTKELIGGAPFKTAVALNKLGIKHEGAVDEPVELYASDAAKIKGWISIEEV